MLASFLYVMCGRVMTLVLLCFRSSEHKELEIAVHHLPEGRTAPVPGKGAGVLASVGRRDRVQRLLDALVPGTR